MPKTHILQGDARQVLRGLPSASVQCVLTSPPYYKQRDYGVPGQIGQEVTLDAYVADLCAVFAEVRRILRPDGSCWLNIGDSYAPDKQLQMVPARLALALQESGWWLRSDIIWHKPAPMPESVRDRPTSAHEHVFLLSRSKCYVYDAEAIAEPLQGEPHSPGNLATGRLNGAGFADNCVAQRERVWGERGWRNAGNVWSLPTENYRGAHFAVMPAALAERCIRAGSRPGDVILDPFAGAFTTALVADRLGRSSIGIELNPDYCRIARERITRDAGMFASLTEQAPPIPPQPEPPLLAFLRDIAPALIE